MIGSKVNEIKQQQQPANKTMKKISMALLVAAIALVVVMAISGAQAEASSSRI